jgi:hypothetical protein
MRKYKFGVTCPTVLFTETAPGPREHEIVRRRFVS